MRTEQVLRSRWFLPAFTLALGVAILAATWAGGDPGAAWASFGVMAVVALALLLGGRSETVRGLRGDGRDERFEMIDLRATAFAGTAVVTAVIVAWLVQVARGEDGTPYTWLAAIGGAAYILAIVVQRLRG